MDWIRLLRIGALTFCTTEARVIRLKLHHLLLVFKLVPRPVERARGRRPKWLANNTGVTKRYCHLLQRNGYTPRSLRYRRVASHARVLRKLRLIMAVGRWLSFWNRWRSSLWRKERGLLRRCLLVLINIFLGVRNEARWLTSYSWVCWFLFCSLNRWLGYHLARRPMCVLHGLKARVDSTRCNARILL